MTTRYEPLPLQYWHLELFLCSWEVLPVRTQGEEIWLPECCDPQQRLMEVAIGTELGFLELHLV
jgi:hypothetical protein